MMTMMIVIETETNIDWQKRGRKTPGSIPKPTKRDEK